MSVIADVNGVVRGKFTIPSGVPVGTKRVEISGAGGASGAASFTGRGIREIREQVARRQTWRTNTFEVIQEFDPVERAPVVRGVDPLAQTFTLDANAQVSGVDLWFSDRPTTDVVVQIRDTATGLPNKAVLAECRVPPSAINTGGAHTRLLFDTGDLYMFAGTEYALIVMCNDPIGACSVAEIGKFDTVGQKWITEQPYTVGVLLSSSNASTWTAHQDRDLTFRLLRNEYTEASRDISLGSVAVVDATDLLLLADVEIPASVTNVVYVLTLPGGQAITTTPGKPIRLALPVTGNIAVTARLTATAAVAPVIYPGAQLLVGKVKDTATYVTRAVPAGAGSTVKVIYNAFLPSGAAVAAEVSGVDAGDTFTAIPLATTNPMDDGFVECIHTITGFSEDAVRVKLTLSGSTSARPVVQDLRVIVL